MLKIGRRMRALRLAKKVTHRQLALAVGVTEGTISRIETNVSEPGAETMARIADYLGVTMDALRDETTAVAATPEEFEARFIAVARRAQSGDQAARLELRRLAESLGSAEADAAAERGVSKKSAARKKGT